MAAGSWIAGIQGLATLLTGSAAATQRRSVLKVIGQPIFDDGTQSVLGGVQVITGSGTWDGKSGTILVKGSGARNIALPDPTADLQYQGLTICIVDAIGNSTGGNLITFGTGAETIGTSLSATLSQFQVRQVMWISASQWSAAF